jgi:hypothetical protein
VIVEGGSQQGKRARVKEPSRDSRAKGSRDGRSRQSWRACRSHVLVLARAATPLPCTSCRDGISSAQLSHRSLHRGYQLCEGCSQPCPDVAPSSPYMRPLDVRPSRTGCFTPSTNNIASPHSHCGASTLLGHLHAGIWPNHIHCVLLNTMTWSLVHGLAI